MTKARVIPIFIFISTIVSGLVIVILTNKVKQPPVKIQKTQAVCDSDPGCPSDDTGYYDTCSDGTVRWCTNYKRFAADIAGCGPNCFLKCDETICDKVCPNPTATPPPPTAIPIPTNTPVPPTLVPPTTVPPTATPIPTNTPVPTSSCVPLSGQCSEAGQCCSPYECYISGAAAGTCLAPSATPIPTNTPVPPTTVPPTEVPPTATPIPTNTPVPPTTVPPTEVPPTATPSPVPTNIYVAQATNTSIPTNGPTIQPSLLATGVPDYLSFLIPIIIIIFSLML